MVRCGLALLAVVGLAGVAAGGDLQPPPGAVSPTMKTLDQVEAWTPIDPRTAVGDEGAVVLITQPGRYRLVGDIIGQAGKHGIRVTADDVSIDTNGFSLIGVAGSLDGIRCEGGKSNIGPVRWMAPESIRSWGGNGITCVNAENVRIQNIEIVDCDGVAIHVLEDPIELRSSFTADNVRVRGNGGGCHVECAVCHLISFGGLA